MLKDWNESYRIRMFQMYTVYVFRVNVARLLSSVCAPLSSQSMFVRGALRLIRLMRRLWSPTGGTCYDFGWIIRCGPRF